MKNNNEDEIILLFNKLIENIDFISKSNFYDKKENLSFIKTRIVNWYNNFQVNGTLKNITAKELKIIDLEITDLFDIYISKESVKENYVERLYYYFGKLEKEWKKEMLGEK